MGRASVSVVWSVKTDGLSTRDPSKRIIVAAAEHLAENRDRYLFGSILSDSTILIPVPKSAPLQKGELWAPLRIAEELHRAGFGAAVEPLVERHTPVRKSSTSRAGNRPSPEEHYLSMRLASRPLMVPEITLVDDVVIKGRTSFPVTARLRDAYPGVPISLFAVARTRSGVTDLANNLEPHVGRIYFRDGDTNRDD